MLPPPNGIIIKCLSGAAQFFLLHSSTNYPTMYLLNHMRMGADLQNLQQCSVNDKIQSQVKIITISNTLRFQEKYCKHTIYCIAFPVTLTQKHCKIWTKNLIMTKHRMFSLKVYPSPEYFTRPLIAMFVPFCMSGWKRPI